MFNTQHILYMLISGVLTVALLALFHRRCHKQAQKDRVLKGFAILTLLVHISDAWVYFFSTGGTVAVSCTHILPIYPCNVVMWMLLAASLLRNKQSIPFQLLSEFCFYIGTICSVVGIVFNTNFGNHPTLTDYGVLKGLLSHSTMLVGCVYLMVGGYVRVRLFNSVSVTAGLATFVLCGIAMNRLFEAFGMVAPDGMFLRSNPYFPFSPIVPGLILIAVMTGVLWLYEHHKKKEERNHERTVLQAV